MCLGGVLGWERAAGVDKIGVRIHSTRLIVTTVVEVLLCVWGGACFVCVFGGVCVGGGGRRQAAEGS